MLRPSSHVRLVAIVHKMHAACSAVIHYGQKGDTTQEAEALCRMDTLIRLSGYGRKRKCRKTSTK